jgi:HEAT repeat protein
MLGLAGCERDPRDIAKWKAEGNTRKLISATDDYRQFVRLEAIESLGELKATEAIDPLAALFSDPDLVIAHAAITAIASMEDPRVEKYMLKALELETVPALTTAATTLGRLKSNAAVDPLIALLDNEHEAVAVVAATSLGQIGNPKAISPLAAKVGDRSFAICMACVSSLKQIGGTDTAKALEPAMGNLSEKIRAGVVEGMVGVGSPSAPMARKALRSANHFARESGMAVLQGLNDVPTDGSDRVWYQLASLTVGENPVVDPSKDTGVAQTNNLEALVEALAHEQREVRDYALLALSSIGEPAAAPALAAAEQVSIPDAQKWLRGRSKWPGAPAWEIDLWAAASALDPGFKINARIASELKPHSYSSEKMMRSQEIKHTRVYIPLLIIQFAMIESEYTVNHASIFGVDLAKTASKFSPDETGKVDQQRVMRCRRMAQDHLVKTDYWAVLPLLAALNNSDFEIAGFSAQTLIKIDERFIETVLTVFSKQLENEMELSGTMFQRVLQDIGTPEAEALVLKIRPNIVQAIKTARDKFPDVEFTNVPIYTEINPDLKAAPFRLAYYVGSRKHELRIIFRPDENGDWVPNPPLPDALAE